MEKIKQFIAGERGKDILILIILVLVGLASFGLGRLSVVGDGKGLKIQYLDGDNQSASVVKSISYAEMPQPVKQAISMNSTINNPTTSSKSFFASSRGSKYYPANCSAGKSIKIANRVYFATRDEAQRAGYEPSSSCK